MFHREGLNSVVGGGRCRVVSLESLNRAPVYQLKNDVIERLVIVLVSIEPLSIS